MSGLDERRRRILTTHTGSLPRPADLTRLYAERAAGQPVDAAAIERAGRAAEGILHFTHDGSNRGFCAVKAGTFAADGNYSPYIGQLGIRAALYALSRRPLPGTEAYPFGHQLVLPDLPVVTRQNVDEWIGRGWGDWERDACGATRE